MKGQSGFSSFSNHLNASHRPLLKSLASLARTHREYTRPPNIPHICQTSLSFSVPFRQWKILPMNWLICVTSSSRCAKISLVTKALLSLPRHAGRQLQPMVVRREASGNNVKFSGVACPRPLECLVGLLLLVGWSEALQHRVVLGVEGLQLRILGFSGSSQDGVCKSDAV